MAIGAGAGGFKPLTRLERLELGMGRELTKSRGPKEKTKSKEKRQRQKKKEEKVIDKVSAESGIKKRHLREELPELMSEDRRERAREKRERKKNSM